MKFSRLFAPVLLVLLASCDSDFDPNNTVTPPAEPAPITIPTVAANAGNFNTLIAALEATGLTATLADPDATFTVFAPTDDAFALLGEDTINALLADPDTLASILTYHVVAGELDSGAVLAASGSRVETVNGADVGVLATSFFINVNQATVIATDIRADNGIIHVIDAVLTPPAARAETTATIAEVAASAGTFTSLIAALEATGLDTVVADPTAEFTVFAPTDDAFAQIDPATLAALFDNTDILSSILLQHVVPGTIDSIDAYRSAATELETASGATIPVNINIETDTVTFGGASIVTFDIAAANGIIHVIDTVVIDDVELPAPALSIAEVAAANESFTVLTAALEATGLDVVLDDFGTDFTVFAPTDDAFALLGDDTINALLADTDTLSDILLYHVVSGAEVLSDAAISVAQSADNKVTMANGDDTALSLTGSTLLVNKSVVSATDVMAGNGVIHVLDQVIIPPADRGTPTQNIAEVVAGDPQFSTLLTAVQTADLVDTLADENATFTVFAPTNDAFDKIDPTVLANLLADVPALTGVLLQHVVAAEIPSVDAYAANGALVDTVAGEDVLVELVISGTEVSLVVQGATVIVEDVYTTNGVIHVIDTVITETLE